MEIHRLHKQGFDVSKIARKLGIARGTVYKYLEKTPEEMAIWLASCRSRQKKLDTYREQILKWLEEHPDLSTSQIHDWLKEAYEVLEVADSTVRRYVASLREEYGIQKIQNKRQYEAIPDPPMGQQAQVDFGTCKVRKGVSKTEIRLWFITFVLSHSRFKYVEWLDRPFTTKDVIECHERAFQYWGGMPKEMVYDQDILISINENGGDIQLTQEFQTYVTHRKFTIHLCRKADPESKGKIENVVGYVKKNFAKHRSFFTVDKWNEQCIKWLERTGNKNVHNTTKKRPSEVHQLEKEHLQSISYTHNTSSIARTVRKDNTIRFRSNRYSVPLGTYKPAEETVVYLTVTQNQELIIRQDKAQGPILAQHQISQEKGKLIQDRNHRRDRSKGITEWLQAISEEFEAQDTALAYLQQVRKNYPRYIRDQLQLIAHIVKQHEPSVISKTLELCLAKKLYSANDFKDVVQIVAKRHSTMNIMSPLPISTLNSSPTFVSNVQAEKRSIDVYVSILKGADSSCV